MCTLTLKDGTVLDVLTIRKVGMPQIQLHVFLNNLKVIDIYKYFDDPNYTQEMIVEADVIDPETGEKTIKRKRFMDYTELYAVQKDPINNGYMIILNKNYDDRDEDL